MASQQGTGFINLNKILATNQNNRLGQQVGSGLSGEKSAIDQERERQKEEFNKSISSTQSKLDADKNKQQQLINNTDANPSAVSDADAKDYEGYRNYTYTGPQGLAGKDALNSGAQNYQQTVDLGRTRGGRQELISRYASPRGYNNPTFNRMDELYLGNKDLQALKGARTGANQLSQQNNQAVQAAEGQVGQVQSQTDEFKQQANEQVNAKKQALIDMLNQRAQTAGTNAETEYQDLLNGGAFQQVQPMIKDANPADISKTLNYSTNQTIDPTLGNQLGLGLSKSLDQYNYGINPDSFVTKAGAANVSNVADANERAKSTALAKLAGVTNPIDTNSAQYAGNSVNKEGYSKAINDTLANYKTDLANTSAASAIPNLFVNGGNNALGALPSDSLATVLQKAAYSYQLNKQLYQQNGGSFYQNQVAASEKNYKDLLNNPKVLEIQSRYNLN